jgi:CDP-paratose 2-epimerase
MHILLSGICGFVGSTLALRLRESSQDLKISGFDNFVRPGSELNRLTLRRVGIAARHANLRNASDIDALPDADWVIDAAANPSVLAGIGDQTSSRQLVEHNLSGTINLLEYCKSRRAGFILLSTSRVYSIKALSDLKLVVEGNAYRLDFSTGSAGIRSSISASRVAATKCAIACIRETLSRSCKSRCRFYRRGERFLMSVEESIIACL